MDDNISRNRTGITGHYQSGDACLEELNKLGKCFISDGGVPSDPLGWRPLEILAILIR